MAETHGSIAHRAGTPERRPDRLRLFRDIEVVPPSELYFWGMLVDGGPIWPDFDSCGPERFNRSGPIDREPKRHPGPHRRIDRPCVWGGFIQRHFGHLVADHLTRIIESLNDRPDDLFLFVGYPDGTDRDIPEYFWSVIDWYGLPRSQVMVVREPLIVAELRCAPQAERLEGFGPSAEYLSALDAIVARHTLQPRHSEILFVTRAGMLDAGKGGHAGEGYLVSVLKGLGVSVLDPAKAPLRDQLEAYAGARTLVFSEGSALHGRQLLGRIDQDIVVLIRRPGQKTALDVLAPRCAKLRHVEAARGLAWALAVDGSILIGEAISFYDTDVLRATFVGLGVDLDANWDDDAFRASERAEARAWLDYFGRFGRLSDGSLATLAAPFAKAGLGDLLNAAPWTRMNWRVRSYLLHTLNKLLRKRKPWLN